MEFFAFFALAVYIGVIVHYAYQYRVIYDVRERLRLYRMAQYAKLIDNVRKFQLEKGAG
jgi:hypothetical protein